MDILYLLIPIALVLAGVAIAAFFWSVNSGQFDDLESPAHRILYDDDEDLIPEDARPDSTPTHKAGNASEDRRNDD
jgi:cbb3-type cytochrome oxidase maturation protein